MGRRRVGEGSNAPSMPKKAPRAPSFSFTPSTAKGNKDAYPLIFPPSNRGLHFVIDEQWICYDNFTNRKTSEQKFLYVHSLRTLGLLDGMMGLIRNLGWMEYIRMQCTSYDYLMLEFLSSSNMNWDSQYRGQEVGITFACLTYTIG